MTTLPHLARQCRATSGLIFLPSWSIMSLNSVASMHSDRCASTSWKRRSNRCLATSKGVSTSSVLAQPLVMVWRGLNRKGSLGLVASVRFPPEETGGFDFPLAGERCRPCFPLAGLLEEELTRLERGPRLERDARPDDGAASVSLALWSSFPLSTCSSETWLAGTRVFGRTAFNGY